MSFTDSAHRALGDRSHAVKGKQHCKSAEVGRRRRGVANSDRIRRRFHFKHSADLGLVFLFTLGVGQVDELIVGKGHGYGIAANLFGSAHVVFLVA